MKEVETGQTVKAAADRILSMMDGALPDKPEEATSDATHPEPVETEGASPEAQAEQETEVEAVEEAAEPTSEEPTEAEEPVTHFSELAEHLDVEEGFLENLVIPTKVNGKEVTPTIKDLVSEFSKSTSADQKLMEAAETAKKQDAEFSQMREQLQQEWGRVQAMTSELDALSNIENEQLDSLRLTDPAEYSARWAESQQRKQKLDQIRNEMSQLELQQKTLNYQRKVAENTAKIPQMIPEWQDEKTRAAEATKIHQYLLDNGLTDQEIFGSQNNGYVIEEGITDARFMKIIRDAMKYNESKNSVEAKKPKLRTLPKVSGGIRKTKSDVKKEEYDEVRGRVRKSGDMKDAALAIEQMMMRGN